MIVCRPAVRRRLPVYLVLLLIFTLASGCKTTKEAEDASKQLDTSATQLCAYYDDLAKQVDETVQLNELLQVMYDYIPFTDQARATLADIKTEINRRSAMAHSLSDLAGAYGKLAGSDVSKDASDAASSLATDLQNAKAIPDGSPIPDIAAEAAKLLVSFAQTHSLKTGAQGVSKAVEAVSVIFHGEEKAYESIQKTRLAAAQQITEKLITNHGIDISYQELVEPATKPFSLSPKPQDVSSDPKYAELLKSQVKFQVEDQERQYAETTQKMASSLDNVRKSFDRIAGGK